MSKGSSVVVMLNLLCHFMRLADIARLCGLVTPGQQNHDRDLAQGEIHPIACADINAQLRYAIAHGFEITQVAG